MIVANQQDVTEAVLSEIERAPDARFREIMSSAIRHLHDFARDCKLTESEFQQACEIIARLGRLTTASHNEVVLMAGATGLSSLDGALLACEFASDTEWWMHRSC